MITPTSNKPCGQVLVRPLTEVSSESNLRDGGQIRGREVRSERAMSNQRERKVSSERKVRYEREVKFNRWRSDEKERGQVWTRSHIWKSGLRREARSERESQDCEGVQAGIAVSSERTCRL